jgi:hypothetical protein
VSINILNNRLCNLALHRLLIRLSEQLLAMVVIASRIKRTLERIAFPTEEVISMISMTSSLFY